MEPHSEQGFAAAAMKRENGQVFAAQLLQWECASERNEPQIAALRSSPSRVEVWGRAVGQTGNVCGCLEEVVVREGFSEEVTSELGSE